MAGFVTTIPAEARGGGGHCGRGAGAFRGTTGVGNCIRSPGVYRGRGPVCGPYRGYHPRYGYGGYGWTGIGNWGYLPCYDGGSPYVCDIKAPPPPPPPVYIYGGGTVVREYGAAERPGGAPKVINTINASPGAKFTTIGK